MKVSLIGLRSINFTTDEGNEISGIKLFIAYPEDNVYGKICDSRFITDNVFTNLGVPVDTLLNCIGSDIDIEINPKGKVVGLSCPEQNKKS